MIIHNLSFFRDLHVLVVFRVACLVCKVPTKENIADLPSREAYELLNTLQAEWRKPVLAQAFLCPAAWETVQL